MCRSLVALINLCQNNLQCDQWRVAVIFSVIRLLQKMKLNCDCGARGKRACVHSEPSSDRLNLNASNIVSTINTPHTSFRSLFCRNSTGLELRRADLSFTAFLILIRQWTHLGGCVLCMKRPLWLLNVFLKTVIKRSLWSFKWEEAGETVMRCFGGFLSHSTVNLDKPVFF